MNRVHANPVYIGTSVGGRTASDDIFGVIRVIRIRADTSIQSVGALSIPQRGAHYLCGLHGALYMHNRAQLKGISPEEGLTYLPISSSHCLYILFITRGKALLDLFAGSQLYEF